jgi:glycerol-3-phosphate dehydrogenase
MTRVSPTLRLHNLERLQHTSFDVAVVGGGINGAVSAAALTARGLSVALLERGDFGGVTSQESSNLVWGGFKYLQNYEIPLVAKLCRSRNRLMDAYPTVIGELPFLATLDATTPFPPWLAGMGAAAYWVLGRLATDRPRYLRPASIEELEPVVDTTGAVAGIQYNDAYLKDNDARFVWGFVRSALDRGATAVNYATVTGAEHQASGWRLTVDDEVEGGTTEVTARVVINAAGPYVDGLNARWGVETEHRIVYSKGIHLVVPQLTDSERVLAFFDDTERLFYVIPMADRSVIGTTDTRTDDPDERATGDDRTFLLEQINARLDLSTPLTVDDVISERCGVRPLVITADRDRASLEVIDWTSLSRKHEIDVDASQSIITIFGGKLTDCLNVGEEITAAAAGLGLVLGPETTWFGEASAAARRAFGRRAATVGLDRTPSVEREATVADVLWRRHGPAAEAVVTAADADPSAADEVLAGSDLLRGELALYARREMVVELDDLFRRRTKLAMLHPAAALATDPGAAEIRDALDIPDPAATS